MIALEEEQRLLALAKGTRDQRDQGMRELFEQLRGPLFNLALRMTGQPNLADDAVQETFIDVLRGIPNFRGESRLSTWVFRIAVRAATRVKARASRRTQSLEVDLTDGRPSPAETASQLDGARRILRAIAKLPPAQRAVVSLMALKELSQTEIAEVLGIPDGTVYSRVHEARARLREILDQTQ